MAVMVNGGGAGGGGGWIDITDSVTLGSGKFISEATSGSTGSNARIRDHEQGAYALIENVQPGERYRITAWNSKLSNPQLSGYTGLYAVLLDENDTVLSVTAKFNIGEDRAYDNYGISRNVRNGDAIYAPLEAAIPKMSGVSKLMFFHGGIAAGSTYDDVIVEKYIG